MKEKEIRIDREIFIRYLKGAGNEEDRKIILQWLENQVSENEINRESQKFWDSIEKDIATPGFNSDYLLARIYRKIKLEEVSFISEEKSKTRFVSYLTRIAAVLAIPLLIASLYLLMLNNSSRNTVSMAEIFAPYGTRTDFLLPDGTKGKLNGGSTLSFPVSFSGRTRDVVLSGEAYFEVASNKQKPFIVSTKDIDVKVTGTSFNILAYPDESTTEVTLKCGIVEVLGKGNGPEVSFGILKPNDLFIYNSLTDSVKIKEISVETRLAWIEGKLTFKYEPFSEVIQKLNRWYNVSIKIMDKKLESYIYYGTFQNETFDEVLKLLQFTSPIKYKDLPRKQKQDGTFELRQVELYSRK